MGGIGKTAIAAELIKHFREYFDCIIWRSLINAPSVEVILADLISFVSNRKYKKIKRGIDNLIFDLISCLRAKRCLIVLDNIETVLDFGKPFRNIKEGYDDYEKLFRQICKIEHNSCLVITSRAQPSVFVKLSSMENNVRSIALNGLTENDGIKLLKENGDFKGTQQDWKQIVQTYSGNPLALLLAAKFIQEVFAGNITDFINSKAFVNDIKYLLDSEFDNLSTLEKMVIYEIGINQGPISIQKLHENAVSNNEKNLIISVIKALEAKGFLNQIGRDYELHKIIIEYINKTMAHLYFDNI